MEDARLTESIAAAVIDLVSLADVIHDTHFHLDSHWTVDRHQWPLISCELHVLRVQVTCSSRSHSCLVDFTLVLSQFMQ